MNANEEAEPSAHRAADKNKKKRGACDEGYGSDELDEETALAIAMAQDPLETSRLVKEVGELTAMLSGVWTGAAAGQPAEKKAKKETNKGENTKKS